jgi:hypothetical protein
MRESPGTLKKSPGVFFCPGKEAGMADRMDSLDEIRSLTPEVVRQILRRRGWQTATERWDMRSPGRIKFRGRTLTHSKH